VSRIFLLSPASSNGARAKMLTRAEASFDLARRLKSAAGAPIGEVFAFLSGLYFRGKLTYARAFAPDHAFVITPNEGLRPLDHHVTVATLRSYATVDIQHDDERFRGPLLRDAREVERGHGSGEVVLLGSIASKKYVDALTSVFAERLLFPIDFVGRGDMSRGGLLLRAAREARELTYAPVLGAVRKGKRPARLTPIRGILRDAERGGDDTR
jgi:hypothetical protein